MTKPRPPRPVRVFMRKAFEDAMWDADKGFMRRYSDDHGAKVEAVADFVLRRMRRSRHFRPDGATSAEADVRKLRRALREIRTFVANSTLGYATQQFLVTQIDAALRRKGGRG